MRSPYVFHTLVTCLACFLAGRIGGLVCIVFVTACSLFATTLPTVEFNAFAISVVGGLSILVRQFVPKPSAWVVAVSGAAGQALVVATSRFFLPDLGLTPAADLRMASVAANAMGLLMVVYVLQDAEARSRAERLKLEAEHYRTLAVTAELSTLRAQIRPHFLFNVLVAIAALCRIDPRKAESIVLRLGQLLRRNLEESASSVTTVERELEFVRSYLEIQEVRHEKVLAEVKCNSAASEAEIPAFSIQTLVENAYNHGFALGRAKGKVLVVVSRSSKSVFVTVYDDGVGMSKEVKANALNREDGNPHGLSMVDRQLRIQFGEQARLRVFSSPRGGTIASFKIPYQGAI